MNEKRMKEWQASIPKAVEKAGGEIQAMLNSNKIDPRFNNGSVIEPYLERLLQPVEEGDPPRYIMDVGCGWITSLGRRDSMSRPHQIVGVDIAAPHYVTMLNMKRLPTTHALCTVAAEELGAVFPRGSFDLVWCGGSAFLDMAEPGMVASEMIASTKPGCYTVIDLPKDQGLFWKAKVHDGMLMIEDAEGNQLAISRFHGVLFDAEPYGEGMRVIARKPLAGIIASAA